MKFIIYILLFGSLNLISQHDYKSNNSNSSHQEYPHHASMLLGATSGLYDNGNTGFTFGLEYEYKFLELLPIMGVGFEFETVVFDNPEYIFGFPVFLHPYKGFKFFISPNLILREEETTENNPTEKESGKIQFQSDNELNNNTIHSKYKFFIRMGAGYDFHFEQFSITPIMSIDLIEANTYLVYGVSFGYSF